MLPGNPPFGKKGSANMILPEYLKWLREETLICAVMQSYVHFAC